MSSDETIGNFEIIRGDFRKQFNLLGINEDVSKYTDTLSFSEINQLVQGWNELIEDAERKNKAINMVTLVNYIGAPRKDFYNQHAIKTDLEKENNYRKVVRETLKFLNESFGEKLVKEFSDNPELKEIHISDNIFSMENVSIKPELFRKILTKLEEFKQNSEYSGDSTWVSILKEKNLISTEEEPDNQISEILKKYSSRQIRLAFNPSSRFKNDTDLDQPEVSEDNQTETSKISEFEIMEMEPSNEEKLISIRILADYYGIELPSTLNEIELIDNYYCYKSAWTIDRKNKNGHIGENFSDYLFEEAELLPTVDSIYLEEEDEEDVFLMDELIAQKKFEFYSENLKTFLKEILKYDYEAELQKCEQKGLSKNEKLSTEECIQLIDKYLEKIIQFMNKTTEPYRYELQEYYVNSYLNSLPLNYSLNFINYDFIDEHILELNPIEFQQVIKAMKELSEIMGIDLEKDGSGWRRAFKISLNENS